MTLDAPAASAERHVPRMAHAAVGPHVGAELTCRRSAFEDSGELGRPTPVIIRVVHIAPGPTPTLTMIAPALIRSRVPSADTTLPATSGTPRSSDEIALIASSALT